MAAHDNPAPNGPAPKSATGLYGSELGGNMLRAAGAEAVGTFLLVLAGTAVATAASLDQTVGPRVLELLAIALTFGLALTALVSALGHASGAHLNPAVTLGLAATGKFPARYVAAYLGAQLLGAVLAALAVWAMFGHAGRADALLGAPTPGEGTGIGQAFLAEALITFLLVFVVISVATDERAPAQSAGPAVGFALAAAVLVGGPVSGGARQPRPPRGADDRGRAVPRRLGLRRRAGSPAASSRPCSTTSSSRRPTSPPNSPRPPLRRAASRSHHVAPARPRRTLAAASPGAR